MSQIFYKIVDTRTGVTAYVPDYVWKRTRKLYQVMDVGDLAFMERADDEGYFSESGVMPESETTDVDKLTVGELINGIYEKINAAIAETQGKTFTTFYINRDTEPPGPGEPYGPRQING